MSSAEFLLEIGAETAGCDDLKTAGCDGLGVIIGVDFMGAEITGVEITGVKTTGAEKTGTGAAKTGATGFGGLIGPISSIGGGSKSKA